MARGVSGGFFSWIGAVHCITYLSPYPSQNYRPTLASTCSNRNLACYRFFACLFWWMGWGFLEGGKTDDNTFAWQRLLKCQADDFTRISSVSVSIVKAFK